jgi:hypothetical protein
MLRDELTPWVRATAEAIAATRATATNPAVLDAFVLVIIADGEGPAYPGMPSRVMDKAAAHEDADRIAAAAAELRKLVPYAGSYVSESNYFNPHWRTRRFASAQVVIGMSALLIMTGRKACRREVAGG